MARLAAPPSEGRWGHWSQPGQWLTEALCNIRYYWCTAAKPEGQPCCNIAEKSFCMFVCMSVVQVFSCVSMLLSALIYATHHMHTCTIIIIIIIISSSSSSSLLFGCRIWPNCVERNEVSSTTARESVDTRAILVATVLTTVAATLSCVTVRRSVL